MNGDYQSADEMKKDMLDAGQKAAQRKQPIKASPQPAHDKDSKNRAKENNEEAIYPKQKPAKSGGLFETTLIVISVLALYFAYIIFFLI